MGMNAHMLVDSCRADRMGDENRSRRHDVDQYEKIHSARGPFAYAPIHTQQGTSHARRTMDKVPYKVRRAQSMPACIYDGCIPVGTDTCTSCCSGDLGNSLSRKDVGNRGGDRMDEGDVAFVKFAYWR